MKWSDIELWHTRIRNRLSSTFMASQPDLAAAQLEGHLRDLYQEIREFNRGKGVRPPGGA